MLTVSLPPWCSAVFSCNSSCGFSLCGHKQVRLQCACWFRDTNGALDTRGRNTTASSARRTNCMMMQAALGSLLKLEQKCSKREKTHAPLVYHKLLTVKSKFCR